jgi:tellurite resistance protein TerC
MRSSSYIATGVTFVQKFHWIISVFGVILILSGIKMILQKDQKIHPEGNPLLRK